MDPYDEFASPYVGMGGDPVNLVDPSGGSILSGLSGVARVAITTIGGAIIGTVVGLISGDDNFTGTLIGAGVGFAAGLGSLIKQISWSMGIQTMNAATVVLKSAAHTRHAGYEIYYRYGSYNVSDLQKNNPQLLNQILEELSNLTGFIFQVNSTGILGYSRVRRIGSSGRGIVGHNRAMESSRYARKLVIKMLESGTTTYVNDIGSDPLSGTGRHVDPISTDYMYLDPQDAEEAVNGSSENLNPETLNMAMIMLHEWGHTDAGGNKEDQEMDPVTLDFIGDNQGINEKFNKYNRIRRQMSSHSMTSWGYRRTYLTYRIDGLAYMAMNNKARRAILRAFYKGKPLKFSKGARYIKYP